MKIDLSQFRAGFLEESAEHITSMETGLLDLRSAPNDIELLNAIFRSAHSIKGGAGAFGLTNLVKFTHVLENLLDQLRSQQKVATAQVIEVLLQSVDILQAMLQADGEGEMPADAVALMARIGAIGQAEQSVQAAPEPTATEIVLVVAQSADRRYKVDFRPAREIFESGCNPLLLMRNLTSLGKVNSCELHLSEFPKLAEMDPAQCYLSWTVDLSTTCSEEEVREVFEFVEHLAEVSIVCLDAPAAPAPAPAVVVAPVDPHASLEIAVQEKATVPEQTQTVVAAAPPAAQKGIAKKASAGTENNSIRVSTDKVDRLIDLVGELVIAHVMAEQLADNFTPESLPQLRQAVAAMGRNTRELHERVMGVRMMPVGSLFQRYTRTVYDIAKSTNKQIRLELGGEETEIDKSMLELLGDPLVHLIRNAADHGIESPEKRLAAGKPEEGCIKLSACHRTGRIAIEISDDGAGVDPARVRAKAIERGLISAESQMTDQQLRMLIFEPGFSTRDEVSDLSGRGVGMDVVKRNIQQLSGSVTLTSEVGLGSTVTIELPLTLAILEGLLVRVQDRTLVLPLLSVVETVAPSAGQIVRIAEQGEALTIRGEPIPLIRLSRFLGLAADQERKVADQRNLIVIVESAGKKMGMVVDELLGQQQVVLKSLERHMHKVQGLMGATILGDGCVAPIVDVAGIADMNLFSLQSAGRLSKSPQVLLAGAAPRIAPQQAPNMH